MKHISIFFIILILAAGVLPQEEEVLEQTPVTAQENDSSGLEKKDTVKKARTKMPEHATPAAYIKPLMKTVKTYFKKGNYGAADRAVNTALGLKSDDYGAVKYKGMIALKLNSLDTSEKYLKLAETARIKDAELVFYLGALYDKKGDYITAEKEFLRYKEFGPLNSFAKKMKDYSEYLKIKAAKMRAKKALKQEDTTGVADIKLNTIAVVAFANTGSKKNLNPLQKGLAEIIATDLSKINRLTVIERVQVQALVDEMALEIADLYKKKTAKESEGY